MFDGVVADRTQSQGIPDGAVEFRGVPWSSVEFRGVPWSSVEFREIESLQKTQDLHVFTRAGLAHAGLQKSAQRCKRFGKVEWRIRGAERDGGIVNVWLPSSELSLMRGPLERVNGNLES